MTTREEIYRRIRESSRDEVILAEMIRLGFWPREGELPEDPADEVRRAGALGRELRTLISESQRVADADRVLRAIRKQRMEESRRRRAERKQQRLEERAARAAAWRKRKQTELLYLGEEGVSAGLQQHQADDAKLSAAGLPRLASPTALAQAIGVSLGELRFLAFHRRVSRVTHYVQFAIPKKSGGNRRISAPMPRLKRVQEWILENLLQFVPLHRAAHGFRRGRSIVTNAAPHVGSDVVVNLDLEDFFPTITFRRIKGLFAKLGYSESVATVLALLCSEPQRTEVKLDGETFFVSRGPRCLPQGAPTSPAITNVICRGLDARLEGLARKLGFQYSRYADDITFSVSGEATEHVGRILRRTRHVVTDEGFRVHPRKTRVLRKGRRQEVTGLTVNERVNVSRRELRRFRAVLFQIDRDGPAGKRWGSGGNVLEAIEGYANFVAMVDAEKGKQLQEQVARILAKYRAPAARRNVRPRWMPRPAVAEGLASPAKADAGPPAKPTTTAEKPPAAPKKPWWKFW